VQCLKSKSKSPKEERKKSKASQWAWAPWPNETTQSAPQPTCLGLRRLSPARFPSLLANRSPNPTSSLSLTLFPPGPYLHGLIRKPSTPARQLPPSPSQSLSLASSSGPVFNGPLPSFSSSLPLPHKSVGPILVAHQHSSNSSFVDNSFP